MANKMRRRERREEVEKGVGRVARAFVAAGR